MTPSCGLPPELLDEFKKKCPIEGQEFPSPNSARATNTKNIIISFTKTRKRSHNQPSINIPPFPVGFLCHLRDELCFVIVFFFVCAAA